MDVTKTFDIREIPSLDAKDPNRITRCYCVFEGGGARGLLHIGALKALQEASEHHKIELKGFAGTSAGAIIAALAAAGYRHDELVRPRDPTKGPDQALSLLDEIELPDQPCFFWRGGKQRAVNSPMQLFGRYNALTLKTVRVIGEYVARILDSATKYSLCNIVMAVFLFILFNFILSELLRSYFNIPAWQTENVIRVFRYSVFIPGAVGVAVFAVLAGWINFGLINLDRVRAGIDQAIRKKLKIELDDPEPVTFRRLKENSSGISYDLKIVATNVSQSRAIVFSERTTPNVTIADAVVASIAIPGLFRPREISSDGHTLTFVDGGLVSNMPAWTFDDERKLDLDAVTAVARIETARENRAASNGGDFSKRGFGAWKAAVQTVLSGDPVLETRAIDRLYEAPLDARRVSLLQFDLPYEMIMRQVDGAYARAYYDLIEPMVSGQYLAVNFCRRIAEISNDVLGSYWIKDSSTRVAVFIPAASAHGFAEPAPPLALLNRFNFGFTRGDGGGGPDRFLPLPIEDSRNGLAWRDGEAFLWVAKRIPLASPPCNLGALDKPYAGLRVYVRRDMTWSIALPVDLVREPNDASFRICLAKGAINLGDATMTGHGAHAERPKRPKRMVIAIDGTSSLTNSGELNDRILREVADAALGQILDPVGRTSMSVLDSAVEAEAADELELTDQQRLANFFAARITC